MQFYIEELQQLGVSVEALSEIAGINFYREFVGLWYEPIPPLLKAEVVFVLSSLVRTCGTSRPQNATARLELLVGIWSSFIRPIFLEPADLSKPVHGSDRSGAAPPTFNSYEPRAEPPIYYELAILDREPLSLTHSLAIIDLLSSFLAAGRYAPPNTAPFHPP